MRKSILFVDDDPDDIEIFSEALKRSDPGVEITVAENGLKALNFLKAINHGNLLPSLIILDINMPFFDGKQTFQQIKAHPQFENIVIIIFTSSPNPSDKLIFEQLGVNFITKPSNMEDIDRIAAVMLDNC
jgi:CheY-like chemotaxis protein